MTPLRPKCFRFVAGSLYGTPKEIWGFRTASSKTKPKALAKEFLEANCDLLGLPSSLSGLKYQRTVSSLGANHLIFQQQFEGRRVHRAYVTTHISNDGCVYLAKNRAVPKGLLPDTFHFKLTRAKAVAFAKSTLPKFAKRSASVVGTEELWYPEEATLEPAWRVRLSRTQPREEWIVYVHAETGQLLGQYDNLSKAKGKATVFKPSPVTTIGGHASLLSKKDRPKRPPAEAYMLVTLDDLKTTGFLEGKRVTTEPTRASRRVNRANREFLLEAHQKGFEEVMVYYHIDQAIQYLEQLGYEGKKAIFREPVRVNVNGTREDNSWYSPGERLLTFGTGAIDDAEDAETILHELAHAIQDAIIPDFGQSEQAAAIGEGFGDYFAASFFAEQKPEKYQPCVMTWDGLLIGLDEGLDPPCLRRVDNDWTLDDFIPGDGEHANGEIWSTVLWDIRAALGRIEADRLIVESHFQLDGFTTFSRNARAIIDADLNLNSGANREALQQVFETRQIPDVVAP